MTWITSAPPEGMAHAQPAGQYYRAVAINATWHKSHPIPKPATTAQRIAWHRAHAKHCACRPIPAPLLEIMRAAGDAEPAPGAPVDPFRLAGAFLASCLERGWLVREGQGDAARYYATAAGQKALARLGVAIS
jgi:hypothetical protein